MTTMQSQQVKHVLHWLQAFAQRQLTSDSRKVNAGDVFFAYPVEGGDSRDHMADAIARGAGAVLYEPSGFDWVGGDVPHLTVEGLAMLAGEIANGYYACPDQDMLTVAVTGTNGKTSCTYWLGMALSHLAQAKTTAVIGTYGTGLFNAGKGKGFAATGYTTPDAVQLQQKLRELHDLGATAVAMEASSIGLDQGRMNGMHVDVAVFTNLTRDHLDYHHDMAQYEAAKQRLFAWPGLQHAVINMDDPAGIRLAQVARSHGAAVLGYSLADAGCGDIPVLRASDIKSTQTGTAFKLATANGTVAVKTRMVGLFNVSNVLAVLGVLLSQGVAQETAIDIVGQLTAAPGRMEQLGGQDAPLLVIDYAHTPDALEKTLLTLQDVARQRHGKLWCMFGCGGDRDPGKRPMMGRVSELADEVVLTSDNPRSEEPAAIIEQIKAGMQAKEPHVIEDRAQAILWAVRHAGNADVVLLAGKGHEAYQESHGKRKPFLDADHAALAFAARATKMGGM